MNKQLIVDVGMHTGRDTEFYLKKGFKVVAIEANPKLVEEAQSYFSKDIQQGDLIIHNVAIADYKGEIEFYINDKHDDWGTISKEFADRNIQLGTNNTLTRVKCTTFEDIIKDYETPYYVKIDIEGADTLCLWGLTHFKEKPKYVSIEAGLNSFEETFTELSLLWNLGYREFKIVNQMVNPQIKCPNPPLEGKYVDYHFDWTCSGPFGEEATGEWMSVEDTLTMYKRIIREQKYFGATGKLYKTIFHKIFEFFKGEPAGWYDFHAKLGEA